MLFIPFFTCNRSSVFCMCNPKSPYVQHANCNITQKNRVFIANLITLVLELRSTQRRFLDCYETGRKQHLVLNCDYTIATLHSTHWTFTNQPVILVQYLLFLPGNIHVGLDNVCFSVYLLYIFGQTHLNVFHIYGHSGRCAS